MTTAAAPTEEALGAAFRAIARLPGGPADRGRDLELLGSALGRAVYLLRALEEPTRQIILNTGLDEAAVIVREIRGKGKAIGYDAAAGEITDMIKAGVIDPAKVTKNALLNASSIAGLLLTTEALVAEQSSWGNCVDNFEQQANTVIE